MVESQTEDSLLTLGNLIFSFSIGFISMFIYRYFKNFSDPESENKQQPVPIDHAAFNKNRNLKNNKPLDLENNITFYDREEVTKLPENQNNKNIVVKIFYATEYGNAEVTKRFISNECLIMVHNI